MRTPQSFKDERISHLEWTLEKLLQKDNGYNELEVKWLYTLIYKTISEINDLEPCEALECFNSRIDSKVRILLEKFDIELIV